MKDNKKLISLELSESLLKKIKAKAESQELSMSALIRIVLKSYVESDRDEKN